MAESESGINKGARRYLIAPTPAVEKAPAVGAVSIPQAGKWRVWVRGKDFPQNRPGVRSFSLRVGSALLDRSFGTHGQEGEEGWAWEDGGVLALPAGPQLLVLGEKCRHSARCEAILFTDNLSYIPAGVTWKLGKETAETAPVNLAESSRRAFSPPPLEKVEEAAAATLANERMRITFHKSHMTDGQPAVGMRVAVRDLDKAGWLPLDTAVDEASYRVLSRPLESEPGISRGRVYPAWDTSLSPQVEVNAGGATALTRLGPGTVPWLAGKCLPLRPATTQQVDEKTVHLRFAPTAEGQLFATWILEPGRADALVRLTFKPAQPGHYSLGFHGPVAVSPDAADAWLLPFQFQDRRFPQHPLLLLNSTTPTPMTLVTQKGVSCALVGDPDLMPSGWQQADESRYGFGLRNEDGLAQPLLYSPVMGLPGSRSASGSPVSTRFRFHAQAGDWYASYRGVADGIFELKDYREPTTFSLTDTVFNLMDLLRDEAASGWDARAKGSVQIESRNVVTNSSPLLPLSLYLLTGDAIWYDRLALPSLEFLLSRPEAHFAVEPEIGDNYYHHQPMQGPVRLYGASTYASALAMTHGQTFAFAEQSLLKDGSLRRTSPNGHGQPFDDALALYRATGDSRWLEQAVEKADAYLAQLAERKPLTDPGDRYFVNVSYSSNWEGLLHLHEATGEARFLQAAVAGARQLLTTLWTQPCPPSAEVTAKLNPGGIYDHARSIWWWGDRRKRVGVYDGPASEGPIETPAPRIPEREVPAWTVSNIGLGLEHPFTYVRKEGQANILMSIWAANFLRLSALSDDPAFRIAARNAMIGRFATYPGYYLDGQTDEFRRADYAVKGPDITSLYVHHIAPFTASVLDYLFTDAEVRSKGSVVFPTTRQMGYVWFDSRLWGHAPGQVYGQSAWPWLNRQAVNVNNSKVDHLLAQGDGRLHIILMNQSQRAQKAEVVLNEKMLGLSLKASRLTVVRDNQPTSDLPVKEGRADIDLPSQGLLVLTLDGVKLDVPTQRSLPPKQIAMPAVPVLQRAQIGTSPWQASAAVIRVPPFLWRDFHVSVNCQLGELKSATLRYRLKSGKEQSRQAARFPFEFSQRLAATGPFAWQVEVTLPDGSTQSSAWQTLKEAL